MNMTEDGTVFDVAGPPDAPVVVLVHGLGLNRACWQWTLPALSDRYRVVTYDLFGHGQSAPPPETPSLALFSRQLTGLLDHLDIPAAAIVGFSLGGMIARRVAQDAPQRLVAALEARLADDGADGLTAIGVEHHLHARAELELARIVFCVLAGDAVPHEDGGDLPAVPLLGVRRRGFVRILHVPDFEPLAEHETRSMTESVSISLFNRKP